MSDNDETLEIFFSETEDLLRSAEESLLRLEADPKPGPDVQELFRAIHTLKSGSAMVGFPIISDYSHMLENLLERLRSAQLVITKPLISFLLSDVDFLRQMVDRGARGEPEADPEDIKSRKAQLQRFMGMEAVPTEEEAPKEIPPPRPLEPPAPMPAPEAAPALPKDAEHWRYFQVDMHFREDLFRSGQDPILLLLGLSETGEILDVIADTSHLPPYKEMDPYSLYLYWRIIVRGSASLEEIEDIFMFVKDDNDIKVTDVTSRYKEGVDVAMAQNPLGEVLMERGAITKKDLNEALEEQKKLGEILVQRGKLDEGTLRHVVSQQEESRQTYRKTSVRVDVEKINHLVNLAEEIGIALSRVRDLVSAISDSYESELEQEMEHLVKVNREFQERVSQIRMFPLEGTFRRFQRIARDTAFEQNKRVKVLLSGVDTELDKEVIEHITDPLKHIVRNCVDHGLESPQERERAGKPAEGVIEFSALQKGGQILVKISDDGRGMDTQKIAARALEKGLIRPGEPVDSSNLLDIICKPGFSTAESVTSISGRGVGMDVVKVEVERMGGTIGIETQKGRGTTFTLSLPLTFALMDALHVMTHSRSYLVPLWGVVGTEKYEASRAKFFGASQRLYIFRDEYIPLVDLGMLYGVNKTREQNPQILVFVDTSRQRFGIMVDRVLDPHQVVVKSLETNYRAVQGIAGATIMGDGSLALVTDLFAIEEMFFKPSARSDA